MRGGSPESAARILNVFNATALNATESSSGTLLFDLLSTLGEIVYAPSVNSHRRQIGKVDALIVKRLIVAMSVLVVLDLAVAACGSARSSFVSSAQVVAALSQRGAPCTGATYAGKSTARGGVGPFADCSGTSAGDTSIGVFDNQADAMAFARRFAGTYGAVEVVGPNWVVNTLPGYAVKVQRAIGGEIIK